jgi:hypothetical protein
MPTWGTVLSPQQIRDLGALLRAWQRGETVSPPGPGEHLHEAAQALEHGEVADAQHQLEEAAQAAAGEQLELINQALDALKRHSAAQVSRCRGWIQEERRSSERRKRALPWKSSLNTLCRTYAGKLDEAHPMLEKALGRED